MGHTNSTANLSLPQFIGTDKPTWLGDVNGAFSAIDSYAGTNDAAVAAAASDASSAISQAAAAVNTANTANTTAGNASTAATAAVTAANQANALSNQIALRTGVLSALTTTDKTSIVNAINEVNGKDAGDIAYDNSGSGLTATNVQAAIDEVAQGGGGSSAWTLLGSETGSVSISLPATFNELHVKVDYDATDFTTFSIIKDEVSATTHTFKFGDLQTGGGSGAYLVDLKEIKLSGVSFMGNVITNSAITTVYYR